MRTILNEQVIDIYFFLGYAIQNFISQNLFVFKGGFGTIFLNRNNPDLKRFFLIWFN